VTISAVMPVYNEEARIEFALRSVQWCDEIVVLNKQSTDRTRAIAEQHHVRIIDTPFTEFDTYELEKLFNAAQCEWVILVTASDVIHPKLAGRIRTLLSQKDFPYDVIHVPFRRYVLGIENRRSPWYSELAPVIMRKSIVKIEHGGVHGAITAQSDRYYKMANNDIEAMYHLTHATVDSMMEHSLRYCHAEAKTIPNDYSVKSSFKKILTEAKYVVWNRKSFLLGWNGIMLSCAYVLYWMMRLLYIWERHNPAAPEKYSKIRSDIAKAWEAAPELQKLKSH